MKKSRFYITYFIVLYKSGRLWPILILCISNQSCTRDAYRMLMQKWGSDIKIQILPLFPQVFQKFVEGALSPLWKTHVLNPGAFDTYDCALCSDCLIWDHCSTDRTAQSQDGQSTPAHVKCHLLVDIHNMWNEHAWGLRGMPKVLITSFKNHVANLKVLPLKEADPAVHYWVNQCLLYQLTIFPYVVLHLTGLAICVFVTTPHRVVGGLHSILSFKNWNALQYTILSYGVAQ